MNKSSSRINQGGYNADTKVSTIEKKYGIDLGVRSDTKLGDYFSSRGYPSLAKMLR